MSHPTSKRARRVNAAEVSKVTKPSLPAKTKAVSINRNLQITQIALAALAICSIAIAAGVGTFVLRYMFDHIRKQVFQVASQSLYTSLV